MGVRAITRVAKAIKTTIKRRLRSRKPASIEDEVLAMVLAFNNCRLLVARREHGIEIEFADELAMRVVDGREAFGPIEPIEPPLAA